MAVNATNTTTGATTPPATTSATTGAPTAQAGLNKDYDQFLKLLTTELTNQDPTTPLDTNQITQQIASLSQVQQTLNTNTKLDQLLAYYNTSQANEAVSYIGKQVDATGNQINLSGSVGAVVYNLPKGAVKATVSIVNSAGATVFSSPGTSVEGRNQLLLNGAKDANGVALPDGTYTFKVDATDADGKAVAATTFTSGVVTSVNTQNGTNSLSLGSLTIPLNTIQSIYTAGTNPSA